MISCNNSNFYHSSTKIFYFIIFFTFLFFIFEIFFSSKIYYDYNTCRQVISSLNWDFRIFLKKATFMKINLILKVKLIYIAYDAIKFTLSLKLFVCIFCLFTFFCFQLRFKIYDFARTPTDKKKKIYFSIRNDLIFQANS